MRESHVLKNFEKIKMVSLEEEKELIRQYKEENNKAAGDKVIASNWRFVAKLAHQHAYRYNASFLDLFQEGNIGMKKALDKFDLEKSHKFPKYRFTSYAQWWVKALMQLFIMNNYSTVRQATKRNIKLFFFKNIDGSAKQFPKQDTSLDAAIEGRKGGRFSLLDTLDFEGNDNYKNFGNQLNSLIANVNPEEIIAEHSEHEFLSKRVNQALQKLTERERDILQERFMLDEDECKTLDDLGKKHGVSRERIRQIETSAMKKFKFNFTV